MREAEIDWDVLREDAFDKNYKALSLDEKKKLDKEVGARLALVRKLGGKLQKEVAYELSLTQAYISSVESGKRHCYSKYLKGLSIYYNVDLNWLRSGDAADPQYTDQNSLYRRQDDIQHILNELNRLPNKSIHFIREWIDLFVRSQISEK